MAVNEIGFASVPPVGTELQIDKRPYLLVKIEPYVRRTDGAASHLLHWRGSCADCGVPFFVVSGLVCKNINRRCDEHKRPFKPATKSAAKRMRTRGKRAPSRVV